MVITLNLFLKGRYNNEKTRGDLKLNNVYAFIGYLKIKRFKDIAINKITKVFSHFLDSTDFFFNRKMSLHKHCGRTTYTLIFIDFISVLKIAGLWQQQEFTGPPLPYAALIDELKPATRYTIRVIAEGPAGRSVPSAELIVRTEPQRPAGPPINLEARALSSSEILITWSPPLPELRHGDIQGFNVGYRETR